MKVAGRRTFCRIAISWSIPFFKEDKWIKAIEARPGNRAVVHHIIVGFSSRSIMPKLGLGGGSLVGYAPGMPPAKYPEGAAMFVPSGSKLVVPGSLHAQRHGAIRSQLGGHRLRRSQGQCASGSTVTKRPTRISASRRALTISPSIRGIIFRMTCDWFR